MIVESIPDTVKRLIMKFGSSCIKTPYSFDEVADVIIERQKEYSQIVVVASAMGDMTDQLISLAKLVHPNPPKREYDMMVSVGERISIALLAMALSKKGNDAISFTGSQSGIITSDEHSDAQIIDVRPERIIKALHSSSIVIVAGFQGVSEKKEITTLGRGGSDTTAVALGVSLKAEKVEFYKDVAGIADKDPNQYEDATYFKRLSYDRAFSIVSNCKLAIVHPRAILLAKQSKIPLEIRSLDPTRGKTYVGA